MSYYKIDNLEQYFKHYNKSVREPRKFWGKIAEENLLGTSNGKRVEFNMAEAEIKWFYRSQSKYCKIVLIDILQNAVKTAIVLNQMTLRSSSITYNL
jgi:acetyl-CoA synthetase